MISILGEKLRAVTNDPSTQRAIVGFCAGFAFGLLMYKISFRRSGQAVTRLHRKMPSGLLPTGQLLSPGGGDSLAAAPEQSRDYKLVLVVRSDLSMGKGKIAAQCSHAAVAAVENATIVCPEHLARWKMTGQQKVVVKANGEEELLELHAAAKQAGLTTSQIHDAGRTQVAAGTLTVLAVGPGPVSSVDTVTSHLRLL